MKALRLSLLIFASLLSLCTPPARVEPFSYAEVQAQNPLGTPGIRYGGFVNTAATSVYCPKDALRRTEAECALEYDATISVSGHRGKVKGKPHIFQYFSRTGSGPVREKSFQFSNCPAASSH